MSGQARSSDTTRKADSNAAGSDLSADGAERDELQLLRLGQHIRNHRLQHRQPYVDRPWSQEDLAVAIGSDKAHINRLECGRQRPTPNTLDRICDALDLPWPARRRILGLAGFLGSLPVPKPEEAAAIASHIGRILHSLPYPAYIVDQDQRICDVNIAFSRVVLNYRDRASCLGDVRGHSMLELLLETHPASFRLRNSLGNFQAYVTTQLILLRRALQLKPSCKACHALLNDVLADRQLCSMWLRMSAHLDQDEGPDYLDHYTLEFRKSEIGPFSVQVWRASLQADERFSVVHLVPVDDRTRAKLGSACAYGNQGQDARQAAAPRRAKPAPKKRAFPSGPITLVVPWASGGVTDIGARILAPFVEREIGERVIVVNRDEAQSPSLLTELAALPADGHHLVFLNQPALEARVSSWGEHASLDHPCFRLVATQAFDPLGVFVRPESRCGSIRDLIKHAAREPGAISVGTSGAHTPAHLGALMLENAAGVEFRFVHFRGSMEHMARFLAGQTDVAFFGSGIALPAVRADELRVLGMFTDQRFELTPGTVTLGEAGYRGLSLASARSVFAPRNVSARILEVLRTAFAAAVSNPEHTQAMHACGLGVRMMDDAGLAQFSDWQKRQYQHLLPKTGQFAAA